MAQEIRCSTTRQETKTILLNELKERLKRVSERACFGLRGSELGHGKRDARFGTPSFVSLHSHSRPRWLVDNRYQYYNMEWGQREGVRNEGTSYEHTVRNVQITLRRKREAFHVISANPAR